MRVKIKDLEVGQAITSDFGVLESELLTGTNGNYLKLKLTDGVDSIIANYWNYNFSDRPEVGSVICISGSVNIYNKIKNLKIDAILSGSASKFEFMRKGIHSKEYCLSKIKGYISDIDNKDMKNLVATIFEEYEDAFTYVPAAVVHHHNYLGGTMQHTLEVLLLAYNMATILKKECEYKIDLDFIIAGSLLHDIGKCKCYCIKGFAPDMTNHGRFYDHIVTGAMIINDTREKLGISETEPWFMKLSHMILSHHENLEWGSPVSPCFMEALIVARADALSACTAAMDEELKLQDEEWGTKKSYQFKTYLHKDKEE